MNIQILATVCFALAVIHTFFVSYIQKVSHKYQGTKQKLIHMLGEVELVFGFWAVIFLIIFVLSDFSSSVAYVRKLSFFEPIFVFVIMTICSTKPVLFIATKIIEKISNLLPTNKNLSFFATTLTVGPILGSFITEPAAMTVTALILYDRFYKQNMSQNFMYATLATLFVNISIGGTLTHFAAPPVLMVASKWNWDLVFMFTHFGWKALVAVVLTTLVLVFRFKNEIVNITQAELQKIDTKVQWRGALLVAIFLAGLVVLGGMQTWWLGPLLSELNSYFLYGGSIILTAVVDNAALTYLGSQVSNLADTAKYFLVAGSVVGGGLTVIANAPNPVGFGILNSSFGEDGIDPLKLFVNALIPTSIAGVCFLL